MSDSEQSSNSSDIQKQVFSSNYCIIKLPIYTYPAITIQLQIPCTLYKTNQTEQTSEWIAICKGLWKYVTCEQKKYIICVDKQTKHLRINICQQKINFTKSLFLENSWEFRLNGQSYTLEITNQSFQAIMKINQQLDFVQDHQVVDDLNSV